MISRLSEYIFILGNMYFFTQWQNTSITSKFFHLACSWIAEFPSLRCLSMRLMHFHLDLAVNVWPIIFHRSCEKKLKLKCRRRQLRAALQWRIYHRRKQRSAAVSVAVANQISVDGGFYQNWLAPSQERPTKSGNDCVFSSEVGGGVWLHSSLALANVLVNAATLRRWQPTGMVFVVARGQWNKKANQTDLIWIRYEWRILIFFSLRIFENCPSADASLAREIHTRVERKKDR